MNLLSQCATALNSTVSTASSLKTQYPLFSHHGRSYINPSREAAWQPDFLDGSSLKRLTDVSFQHFVRNKHLFIITLKSIRSSALRSLIASSKPFTSLPSVSYSPGNIQHTYLSNSAPCWYVSMMETSSDRDSRKRSHKDSSSESGINQIDTTNPSNRITNKRRTYVNSEVKQNVCHCV